MDKPIKDWGKGIPKYTDADVLSGLELQEFCTNLVAKSMQDNDGFTIEGIVVNNKPTQVIANKNGKRYAVIVAGKAFPNDGRIAYNLRKNFSNFCKQNGFIPMFAPVSLMPQDEERAAAGLLLKYDGYYIRYLGLEPMNLIAPTVKDEGYRAYCCERILSAYSSGKFDDLYPLLADNFELHSQWVKEPIIGKNNAIQYFEGKGKSIRSSGTNIQGQVVEITESTKKVKTTQGILSIYMDVGKECIIMCQDKKTYTFLTPDFDNQGKIIKIGINDPVWFAFTEYYTFDL